ncbi:MarR family winged helix-turn-helix transcriptional regulator [Pseudonocardia sp. GCM10023141]|uniref:MarR family winged helix-turn-helix transcriptional regulator n=1 Tax=Pseudonocardia sp. GCM10023141 TaxID=3252653 RepID=UPI00362203D2
MTADQWLSPSEASAWRSYLISNQLLMRALERQLQRDSGIAHTHYGILVQLSDRPTGSARVTELAVLMDHSQSRVSHAISRLEREGLVRRELDPNDGRMVHAVLTDAGRELLQTAAPGHVRCVRENVFDGLTAEQVGQLQSICDAMMERLTGDKATSPLSLAE